MVTHLLHTQTCQICNRKTDTIAKHHVIPKSKGGSSGETINCCLTCSQQLHMLFTNKELSKLPLSKLLQTESMKNYINWIQDKPANYSLKQSKRIKKAG